MAIPHHTPWLWLGLDQPYVAFAGPHTWQPLRAPGPDGGSIPWCAKVPCAGGATRLARVAERVGQGLVPHNTDLHLAVLRQLVEAVGAHGGGPPLIFCPPCQAPGLTDLARRLKPAPAGLVLDCVLLTTDPEPTAADADAYVLDWRRPQDRVAHALRDRAAPAAALLRPALTWVLPPDAAPADPLSYDLGDKVAPAEVKLELRPQATQGKHPCGLALAWTWGPGPRMWQWALTPRALEGSAPWSLSAGPGYRVEVVPSSGEATAWALRPPTMTWDPPAAGPARPQVPA